MMCRIHGRCPLRHPSSRVLLVLLAAGPVACGDPPETSQRGRAPVEHPLVEDPLPPLTETVPTGDTPPELRAMAAPGGLIVQAVGGAGTAFTLEALTADGAWIELTHMTGDSTWIGPALDAPVQLRAHSVAWAEDEITLQAEAPTLVWRDDSTPEALLEGDQLARSADWAAESLDLGEISTQVSLTARGSTLYLPSGCGDVACWTEAPVTFDAVDALADVPESLNLVFRAPALGPAVGELLVEVTAHVDGVAVLLARATLPLRVLGGRWRWGDLHAHSRWSNDGCEDSEDTCGPRGDLPAEDFFANAASEDLDFAAITDHAEFESYWPQGDTGESLDVWDGQAGTVADALTGSTLPILGYEWTASSDEIEAEHMRGSHRTVLLADPSACDAYRIGGSSSITAWVPVLGSWLFTDDGGVVVTEAADLWPELDAAADTCGASVRWLTFAHHPAYATPQTTDWYLTENRPDRETLVEIFSEHGCSECLDPEADGCDFDLNTSQHYYADGSVQTALDLGFKLGFLAGTDSHDSRPGSLSDGPSAVAWWKDTDGDGTYDTPSEQFGAGGLSGVLLGGSLDTEALFDALDGRRTAATSGPRPDMKAYVLDAAGTLYLMGDPVRAADGPFTMVLEGVSPRDDRTGATLAQIDRVGPGGVIEDSVDGVTYEATWTPAPGDYAYLRLRYSSDDGTEARVWISPWFAE